MARSHRWQARRRIKVGPFYRTLGATVDRRGARTSAGAWHLKITRKLSVNLEHGTYHWNHDGPGAVTGPIPGWTVVRGILAGIGALIVVLVLVLVVIVAAYII